MNIRWHEDAVEEFLELEPEAQEYITSRIDELPEKGLKWEKVESVRRDKVGLTAFRLKLDPGDRKEINHRIIFDIVEKGEFKIVKLGRRPEFYSLENLEEAQKRL
jgi:mRNA-degrading endonuclease RelE of RelBE toxin-antitoxin system